jgi:VWFA-related protein
MRFPSSTLRRLACAALLLFLLPAASVFAQQPTPTAEVPPDDVLRINTELVQTDVMVFDKEGRFVDNLKREEFELRVDGKPQAISFFDRVVAGSVNEEAQLAAARGVARPAEEKNPSAIGLQVRGRVVVFFIDDLHMSPDSLRRTKKTLLSFIDKDMGQNDQAAIASTSGQIGFLQQLTDNKTVLRTAVERLGLRAQQMGDGQRPPMSEYMAQEIIVRYNQEVLDFYKEALIKDGVPPGANLDELVRSRARAILDQSDAITRNTFFSLDSLTRTIAPLPGRKLIFFMSDGFLINTSRSEINQQLASLTNVAARNGVVIYTMDARGLVVDPSSDASQPALADNTGRMQTAAFGELTAMQSGLRTLADNTGGRALLNRNALDAAITKTLKETSNYYIISWRPDTEGQKSDKLRRIELKVTGRPDLKVQVKRGFLPPSKGQPAKAVAAANADKNKAQSSKPKTPADELRAAVGSFYSLNTLPTMLALDYIDSAQAGATLTISIQIPAEALSFDPVEGKYKAAVDVGGSVYNDKGQVGANFGERLSVAADSLEPQHQAQHPVVYSSQVRLTPGLYQVRVAARDAKTGRIGNATQWVEIPDLKTNRLALSSLLVGETKTPETANAGSTTKLSTQAQLNVARRFARASRLRFMTFIYNASRGPAGTAAPDVALQIQVRRDDQPVLTTALRKVNTEGLTDLARIPYAAEILLDKMPPGQYLLQVTAIDRVAKASASQLLRFAVE